MVTDHQLSQSGYFSGKIRQVWQMRRDWLRDNNATTMLGHLLIKEDVWNICLKNWGRNFPTPWVKFRTQDTGKDKLEVASCSLFVMYLLRNYVFFSWGKFGLRQIGIKRLVGSVFVWFSYYKSLLPSFLQLYIDTQLRVINLPPRSSTRSHLKSVITDYDGRQFRSSTESSQGEAK